MAMNLAFIPLIMFALAAAGLFVFFWGIGLGARNGASTIINRSNCAVRSASNTNERSSQRAPWRKKCDEPPR